MQGMGDDRGVKNRWLWQGMQRLGIQVLNVAEDDIAELQALGVKRSRTAIGLSLQI